MVVPLCLHVMKLCVEVKRFFLVEIHGAESLTDEKESEKDESTVVQCLLLKGCHFCVCVSVEF